jgi:hypothetical protein
MASMQPRQISPRKALLLRMSATPAATHGLMSSPSTGAPKKIRNSCSSSGVPWKIWMKPARAARPASDVRASAMSSPPIAPPMKAISDSAERPLGRFEDEQEFGKAEGAHASGGPGS